MPVPKTTAMRSGATPAPAAPDSRHASSAAMTATCWLRSSRRARTRSICSAGSVARRATSWAGEALIQSSVMRLTPDFPASRASQVLATSPPSGVVAPRPVTTTSEADVLMRFLLERWPAGRGRGVLQPWFFSMKLIASPTVLMLPSSSSGMATPNLSSTAVAISTIDSEPTSRSSVNDFSGVASAGVTPATSSRISARPDWISWVLTRGPLSRMQLCGGAELPPTSGTWCPGVLGERCRSGSGSWQPQHLAGEGEAGAVAEHQGQVAGLGFTRLQQRGQRERHGGGGGVARLHDVAGDHGLLAEAEPLGHRLDDAQVGLVRGEHVDVVRRDAGLLHRLDEGLGELRRRPPVDRLTGHGHRGPACRDLDRRVLVAVAAPGHRPDAWLVGRAHHGRAGPVGEDHRRRTVGQVGDVGEPLDPDDERVARVTGADGVGGQAQGVA